jgi:transcription factor CP2-like protein
MRLACSRSTDFTFIMDAPVSIAQRRDLPSLTYINKGQHYTLRGRHTGPGPGDRPVRTSLYLLFQGEQKPREREGYWRHWRDHQPARATRALSIDPGVSVGIRDVTPAAFNGVEFTWTPAAGCVVRLSVNCLSTDFTPQKGVKGIPLQLQVDVWPADPTGSLAPAPAPLYRALCHIKVFRDKGAERKHKDERNTADKRLLKFVKEAESSMLHCIAGWRLFWS